MLLHRSQISAPAQPDTVRNLPAVADRHDLVTVAASIPAAWPAGVSQLAQAIDACQNCEGSERRGDWLTKEPFVSQFTPTLRPGASAFTPAGQAKKIA